MDLNISEFLYSKFGLFSDCLKISSSTTHELCLSFPLDDTDRLPLRDDDFEVCVEDDEDDDGDGTDDAFCDKTMVGFSIFFDCSDDNDVIGGGGSGSGGGGPSSNDSYCGGGGGGPSSNDSYCGAGPSLIEE